DARIAFDGPNACPHQAVESKRPCTHKSRQRPHQCPLRPTLRTQVRHLARSEPCHKATYVVQQGFGSYFGLVSYRRSPAGAPGSRCCGNERFSSPSDSLSVLTVSHPEFGDVDASQELLWLSAS